MRIMISLRTTTVTLAVLAVVVAGSLLALPSLAAQQPDATQPANAPKRARAVGTIKSIDGSTLTLTTDNGAEMTVVIQPATRLVRMAPGQSDPKTAPAIQLSDLHVGDRMAAGGTASEDGKSITATSALIMNKADVAEKQ